MNDRKLIKGATYQWNVYWKTSAGSAVDFTTGSRVGYYRLRRVGSSSTALTLNTDDASEFTWTSQATGAGYITITSLKLASVAEGRYVVDSYWEDTGDSPTTRQYMEGVGIWEILDPENGDF